MWDIIFWYFLWNYLPQLCTEVAISAHGSTYSYQVCVCVGSNEVRNSVSFLPHIAAMEASPHQRAWTEFQQSWKHWASMGVPVHPHVAGVPSLSLSLAGLSQAAAYLCTPGVCLEVSWTVGSRKTCRKVFSGKRTLTLSACLKALSPDKLLVNVSSLVYPCHMSIHYCHL